MGVAYISHREANQHWRLILKNETLFWRRFLVEERDNETRNFSSPQHFLRFQQSWQFTNLADQGSELIQICLTLRSQTKFPDSLVELLGSFKRVFLIRLFLRLFEEANVLKKKRWIVTWATVIAKDPCLVSENLERKQSQYKRTIEARRSLCALSHDITEVVERFKT